MTTAKGPDGGVHRLVDIVVEEVSLVDRAANKHRFLIVKRSEAMDESTTNDAAVEGDGAQDQADDGIVTAEDEGTGAQDPSVALAVEALEQLTAAVEELGAIAPEQAQGRVNDLAAALRGIAERLGGSDEELTDLAEDTDGTEDTDTPPALDSVLASVKETLARVGTLLDTASRPAPAPKADPAPAPKADPTPAPKAHPTPTPAPTPTPPPDLDARLTEVLTAVRQLGASLTDQQQRVSRMEKRFGLPNSTPSGERPRRRTDDEDVGWPLDLNRPCDRNSVDKTISFHDL